MANFKLISYKEKPIFILTLQFKIKVFMILHKFGFYIFSALQINIENLFLKLHAFTIGIPIGILHIGTEIQQKFSQLKLI